MRYMKRDDPSRREEEIDRREAEACRRRAGESDDYSTFDRASRYEPVEGIDRYGRRVKLWGEH